MYPESIYQYEMLKHGYRIAELLSPVIQECKEILSSIWEELKETFTNIVKWIVDIVGDILLTIKNKSYHKIKHFSNYSKKHRTRKKNLKRLQKIIENQTKT